MALSVHSLGSGSSGNSMLIQGGGTRILLDAGITVRQLQKRLSKFRVGIGDLDAVFLTHEHGDHSLSARILSKQFDIPVIANCATFEALSDECSPPKYSIMDTGGTVALDGLLVESFPVSHDAVDPVGYNIYYRKWKASFVTDTGSAGSDILQRIEDANLVIVESNHDVDRLVAGPYPWFLKNRILSDVGHLSNEAAADLILTHVSTGRPTCFWLAHLSGTNNSPRMARRHVQRRLSEEKCRNVIVEVALRDAASLTWRPGSRAVQKDLFSG